MDDTLLRNMRQWGAPPDAIARTQEWLSEQQRSATVEVWPEHWHAVLLFSRLATQWHWASAGMQAVRTGLRYSAAAVLMGAIEIPKALRQPKPELWRQLQVLESAALAAMRE